MAVLSSTMPNIADLMKSLDPDHKLAKAANLMTQANQLVPMLPVVEANNITHHRVTQVVALGAASERGLNQGTQATKNEKAQHDEGIALVDKWNICDKKIAELSGDVAAFRGQETRLGTVSVSQRVSYLTILGNKATNDLQFTGLLPRYNSLADTSVAQQIVDCGGLEAATGALTSMWLVRSGVDSVFLTYPKGSKGGLFHHDYGLVAESSASNSSGTLTAGYHMAQYKDQIGWDVGLVVKDQRCVVRLGNINPAHFTALTSTQAPATFENLIHKMMIAHGRLPLDVMGDDFYVANRVVRTGLMRLAYEKSTPGLGVREGLTQLGKPTTILTFWDVPILLEDQITSTETFIP